MGVDCRGLSGVDQDGEVAFTEVQEGAAGGWEEEMEWGVSNIFCSAKITAQTGVWVGSGAFARGSRSLTFP